MDKENPKTFGRSSAIKRRPLSDLPITREKELHCSQRGAFRQRLGGVSFCKYICTDLRSSSFADQHTEPQGCASLSTSHESSIEQSGSFRQRLHGISTTLDLYSDIPVGRAVIVDQAEHQLKQSEQGSPAISPGSKATEKCKQELKSAVVVAAVHEQRSQLRYGFQSDLTVIVEEEDSSQCSPIFLCPTQHALKEKPSTPDCEKIIVNGHVYTILSLLGRGGSSQVFQVIDSGNDHLKAIKCVNLADANQPTCDMYLNEIKLLASMQDADCVIRMFDYEYVKEKNMLYVVMEKGDTDFSRFIRDARKFKKISSAMIVYYWTEMLNAVNFIHKHGIIHSDLKPANFLLVSGRLKLIDFGVSSSVQADVSSVLKDSMGGTFDYISPESLSIVEEAGAYRIGYKSDVWSLGCILFNLIYGQSPFYHIRDINKKVAAILSPKYKIEFPSPRIEGCCTVLIQALKMCFVRNPKERASVAELLHLPYFERAGPERGILSQVASIAASVGVVEESDDDPYATAARSIQMLIMKNEGLLSLQGGRKKRK